MYETFSMREVVARVSCSSQAHEQAGPQKSETAGARYHESIRNGHQQLMVSGRTVELSAIEFRFCTTWLRHRAWSFHAITAR